MQRDPTPLSPLLRPSGRPNCKIRMPRRYIDELPPQPPVFPDLISDMQLPSTPSPLPSPTISESLSNPLDNAANITYETLPNSYGVYRSYASGCPSYTPDDLYSLGQVSDSRTFSQDPNPYANANRPWWAKFGSSLQNAQNQYFAPFLNASVFHLMSWFYSGSNLKSLGELDRLVLDVILVLFVIIFARNLLD